jgi:hypothetical protein
MSRRVRCTIKLSCRELIKKDRFGSSDPFVCMYEKDQRTHEYKFIEKTEHKQ